MEGGYQGHRKEAKDCWLGGGLYEAIGDGEGTMWAQTGLHVVVFSLRMLVFRHPKASCGENEAQNFNLLRSEFCLPHVDHPLYIFTL